MGFQMRPSISIYECPLVGWSVLPSVRPSCFRQYAKMENFAGLRLEIVFVLLYQLFHCILYAMHKDASLAHVSCCSLIDVQRNAKQCSWFMVQWFMVHGFNGDLSLVRIPVRGLNSGKSEIQPPYLSPTHPQSAS